MKFIPYLTLNGNAAQAVDFYQQVFGAKNRGIMRFGDRPNPEHPLPDAARDLVLHAELEIEGNLLFFSDTFPGSPFTPGSQVAIAVLFSDEPRLRTVYARLVEGGEVLMELQKTFWAPAYAMVKDQFGIVWQLSLEHA